MMIFPVAIMAIEDENDREFMEWVYLTYHRLMYHEIFKIARDTWLTEDILQMTLVKLINAIDTLRSLSRTKQINYIISASKNTAYTQMKKASKSFESDFDEWENDTSCADHQNPEIVILQQEQLDAFVHVWDHLDERSKYLLRGRYILHQTDSEMAEELGIKADSVRMAVTRAKKIALKQLKQSY